MNLKKLVSSIASATLLGLSTVTSAAVITFNDTTLGTGVGFSYTQDGLTLNVVASNGGQLAKIGAGQFTGLHIPGFVQVAFGTYTFSFSSAISSVEVEFDALSSTGGNPPETIGNFGVNSGGFVLGYTNQNGTTFDGSTITSATNDGQGIFTLTGGSFSSFNFDHAQNPLQNGFVIERIAVNTSDGNVPEPSILALLGIALAGFGAVRRRARAKI